MKNKNYILDKTIILDNSLDIYMRKGVKYYITRTAFNQLKIEKGSENILKFMRKNDISLIGYRHDFIEDEYISTDLIEINKNNFIYVFLDNSMKMKLLNIDMNYCDI
jgi:hypothetical protein